MLGSNLHTRRTCHGRRGYSPNQPERLWVRPACSNLKKEGVAVYIISRPTPLWDLADPKQEQQDAGGEPPRGSKRNCSWVQRSVGARNEKAAASPPLVVEVDLASRKRVVSILQASDLLVHTNDLHLDKEEVISPDTLTL